MLTIDDANTLYEKYKYNNFYYKFSSDSITSDNCRVDFLEIEVDDGYAYIDVVNPYWTKGYFLKNKSTGEYSLSGVTDTDFTVKIALSTLNTYDLYFHMCVDNNIASVNEIVGLFGHPLSSLTVQLRNGVVTPKKIYLDMHGTSVSNLQANSCNSLSSIEWETVNVQTDSNGKYIEAFVSSASHTIFAIRWNEDVYFIGNIVNAKIIPNLYIPTLYKGTPQEVKLYNEDTESYITDFQAYYKGRKLKDNIVELDYDCDDIVDIVIDIQDQNYPPARVKLKAYTELYSVNSQAGLEEAISNGIHTMQVTNRLTRAAVEYVTLSEMDLTDLNLVDSFIHLIDSKMTNVNIIDSEFIDRGNNTITSSKFKDTAISNSDNQYVPNKDISHYNDCTITGCTFAHIGIILTGNITGSTLTNSLIISDGAVEVTGNTFTGKYNKDYFPAQLYLTGDYTVKQNTFNLSGTWSEPAFDMCIIKTIEGFNPSMFINDNSFSLNITYGSEQKDTFYYNLVDDDKIYARRLS